MACNICGGITFPGFVANSCCNPCCRNSGTVSGVTDSNDKNCSCNNNSGSVGGTSDTNTNNNTCGCCNRCCNRCGCGCGCNSCNSCNSCGSCNSCCN